MVDGGLFSEHCLVPNNIKGNHKINQNYLIKYFLDVDVWHEEDTI